MSIYTGSKFAVKYCVIVLIIGYRLMQYNGSKAQKYRGTVVQRHKSTEAQWCKGAKAQRH